MSSLGSDFYSFSFVLDYTGSGFRQVSQLQCLLINRLYVVITFRASHVVKFLHCSAQPTFKLSSTDKAALNSWKCILSVWGRWISYYIAPTCLILISKKQHFSQPSEYILFCWSTHWSNEDFQCQSSSTSYFRWPPPLQSQRSRISLLCTKYNNLLLSYIPLTVASSRPLISPFICRVYAPIKHLLWPLLMTPVRHYPRLSLLQVDFVTDVDFCYHIVTVTVTVTFICYCYCYCYSSWARCDDVTLHVARQKDRTRDTQHTSTTLHYFSNTTSEESSSQPPWLAALALKTK